MLNFFKKYPLIALGVHLVIGYAAAYVLIVPKVFILLIFISFGLEIVRFQNKRGGVHQYFIYIASLVIIYRANPSIGIPEQTDKYFSFIVLFFSILLGSTVKTKGKAAWWWFIFLLVPAMFLTVDVSFNDLRKSWIFNLFGPWLIAMSSIYFYKRKFTHKDYVDLLYLCLLPVITLTLYVVFKAPELEEIRFTTSANFATSGGYGPNQVATILGVGIFILGYAILNRITLFRYKWLDLLILALITFRTILTFSRGGLLGAILALACIIIFDPRAKVSIKSRIKSLAPFILIGVIGIGAFIYVDSLTGGILMVRFTGRSLAKPNQGVTLSKLTSNRDLIMEREMLVFKEYPIFGAGVDMANRKEIWGQIPGVRYYAEGAAHTEYTRLLSEHGFLGILALIILILKPLSYFLKNKEQRHLIAALFIIGYFSMVHSATRMALPSLLMGLGFAKIEYKEEESEPADLEHL